MIRVICGDITQLAVDVIVNAANKALLGGGGVDGAIHRVSGPKLLRYCHTLGGCATGDAKITPGFGLMTQWVIHTVGPIWCGGQHKEPELLENCYRNTFRLALQHGLRSIAFPAISTGVYRFPKQRAAEIALAVMSEYETQFGEIIVCCFSQADKTIYEQCLRRKQHG